MKGIIIAAGYGTRFLPVTKTIPKEMLPLVDRPALDFLLDEFEASGIQEVLVVTSRRKKALEDYLDHEIELETVFRGEGNIKKLDLVRPRNMSIAFVRQPTMRGTGHALLMALPWIGKEPVVVAYPDDLHLGEPPLSLQLIQEHRRTGATVLAVIDKPAHLERYGIVAWESGTNRIRDIVEKPKPGTEPSTSASIGRYLYTPDFFEELEKSYQAHTSGEFYHIGALKNLMDHGRVFGVVATGERLDTGEPSGYIEAILRYSLERPDLKTPTLDLIEKFYRQYCVSSA